MTTQGNDQLVDKLLRTVKLNPKDVPARLALGDYYLRSGCEDRIIEILEPIHSDYPFRDSTSNRLYNRLRAYGYANEGKLVEAEGVCRRAIEDELEGLDYSFLLCFVHLSLREYDQAIDHGRKYMELHQTASSDALTGVDYAVSDSHLSQAHNFLGSAHFERAQWDSAKEQFESSLRLDPGNYLPYINLARIAQRQNDFQFACNIIEEGMSKSRRVDELRMLLPTFQPRPTIAACMMVKDEEELLPGCLNSVRDWVDEIIVVDTGSTDRTIEIAKSYGAKIFHQPWEGNFSKHRNFSIEQATSDWIFIIDADERFSSRDVPLLLNMVKSDEHRIISINVYNHYAKTDHKLTSMNSVRFFRRELNLRYEGIVHNALDLPSDVNITRAPFALEHLGYDLSDERMQTKYDRTKMLLEKQIEDNPDYAFAWFNLAQLIRGKLLESPDTVAPEIIKAAERAVELTDPEDRGELAIHLMALDQLAWTHFYTENFELAQQYARQALALRPDYLDPLMLMGNIYSRTGEYDKALKAYQEYLDIQARFDEHRETQSLILYHSDSRATAYYGMAILCEIKYEIEQAKAYYREALAATPDYLDTNIRLGQLYLQESDLTSAEKFFQAQIKKDANSAAAAVGLGYIYSAQNETEKADHFFRQALDADSHDPMVSMRYGQHLVKIGKIAEGTEFLDRAVDLGDRSPQILREAAQFHFGNSSFDKAAEVYLKILELQPENPEILNDLGNCYYKMGDYGLAEEYYQRSLDTGAALAITYRNLGLARTKLNKHREALLAFEKYSELESDHENLFPLIGNLHLKLENYVEAIGFYEKALLSNPRDTVSLFNLSECYLAMGHGDAAACGYRKLLEIDPDFEPARTRLNSAVEQATGQ